MATTNNDINKDLKIFKLNRLHFSELWNDAIDYIKETYKAVNQAFTTASPFAQLLQVILNLGRMIFYYIEDSITGLNIRTAYRPDQIKGLAQLAGHDPSRSIAARGAITIYYKGDPVAHDEHNVCYIPNKTKVTCKQNGLKYVILFGADNAKMTMKHGNKIEANIVQGELKLQSATGTGEELQSFNFAERNFAEVDQYYVNVYVNNEQWECVSSLIDLGYEQKGCVLRTGLTGGIDIFFGNGTMGAIPPSGATIIVEYITTSGQTANLSKDNIVADAWQFETEGFLSDGSTVDLNEFFGIKATSDIIFGTRSEDITLTQLIAPHVSRSFVLANETNYRYFFKRMNMFSDVEIIRGDNTVDNVSVFQLAYDQADQNYQKLKQEYDNIRNISFDDEEIDQARIIMEQALNIRNNMAQRLTDNSMQDNTIYLYLVPDIKKRISSASNYFNCDESLFTLSKDEQENIINLINASGQRIITIENKIIEPKKVRFAVNVSVKIWDNYNPTDVYTAGLKALSDYFINFTRQDILPVSDIVAIFENEINGVDSVKVWFSADENNADVYNAYGTHDKDFYGIDSFGDVVLTRDIIDSNGVVKQVRDILPLFRGDFYDENGTYYSGEQQFDENNPNGIPCPFMLRIEGYSKNRRNTLEKVTALT